MTTSSSAIGDKLWSYCNVLRDAGLSYGDYLEQLTYLIFLKMMHERTLPPFTMMPDYVPPPIPPGNADSPDACCRAGFDWPSLLSLDGDALETHYRHVLEELGRQPGMLGIIFRKAQNRIQDPAMLRRLVVDLIDSENWSGLSVDVKGDAYEALLERNAQDVKTGAGQYFTPRPLIEAIVDVMRPQPGMKICDPACGTGGFLLASYNHIVEQNRGRLDRGQLEALKNETLYGWEIVDSAARLFVMNLYLHGIGDDRRLVDENPPIKVDDSLRDRAGIDFDMVLTNPPFGKKSSLTIVNGGGEQSRESLVYERDDFWASTSNKQLNFLQHVRSILKINASAAIVVPDNVLFEGGAGETVRRRLLEECDVHTLLRLPTGVFYAQGVKANVLFFDRKPASEIPWTKNVWYYDLRTNKHFTLNTNRLKREDLDEFVKGYCPDNRNNRKATWSEESPEGRWRCYSYDEIIARDKASLDIFWLRDESLEDSANLPDPHILAGEIAEDLKSALEQIQDIQGDLMERVVEDKSELN